MHPLLGKARPDHQRARQHSLPEGAEAVLDAIADQAIHAGDGYAASDIIQSPAAVGITPEGCRWSRLTDLVAASGLGCGALPAALLGPFSDAVTAALATQAERLASLPGGSRS
jgi:hypothetical protein